MDLLFMFMGPCAWQRNRFIHRKDFLMFVGCTKRKITIWIRCSGLKVDIHGRCCVQLGMGSAAFQCTVEAILMAVFGATLFIHVYVFKSRKFRSHD